MGRYRAYDEYQESGVEWLREVPTHWQIKKLRRCIIEHKQGFYTPDPYVDSGVRLLRITDFRDHGDVDIADCPLVEDRSDIKPFFLRNGDFVFARTGGAGSFALIDNLNEDVVFASYLIRFRFLRWLNSAFLRYYFLSDSFQIAVKQNIHGGVNQNVHAEDIKEQYVALPPDKEQYVIAAFLDHETTKIDRLISRQEWLIELLKEKRQAVISHAVTKGLNSDAPMKDSGVEWLGEVPALLGDN